MNRRLGRIALIGVIVIGSIAVAVLLSSLKPEPPKKEIDDRGPLVAVMDLQPSPTRFVVRSQGTIRPRTETVLSAEVSGTITSISPKFIPGGIFEKGEVLMRIDPTNYDVAVRRAEALVRQRQIEFDGADQLRSQGYRAESEYASAAAALASAEAELVRAERDLERTAIRLPYEGIVRAKDADIGQFVSPGARLGVVFATDFAEVRLPLTDQDLAFVDLPNAADMAESGAGRGPMVALSAVQKGQLREWQAQIVRSEGVVDESSRVTYAVARIVDPYQLHGDGEPLPMGTFVAAAIEGNEMENLTPVPRSAIRGSSELLFIDDDNKLSVRNVEVIRTDAEYAFVRGGVQPGDRISLTPIEAPIDGMSVRTTDDPEPDAESIDSDPGSVVAIDDGGSQ